MPVCRRSARMRHGLFFPTVHVRLPRVKQALYNDIYYYMIGPSSDSSSSTGGDPAFGLMYLTLALGSFSLTKLSDNNPIDMLDFIANIGGFWGE